MNDPLLSGGMPQPDDAGVHKIILDNNEIIDELMLTLRGEIVDTIKNEIRQIGEPVATEQAMSWIVGRILPYTSKIFALSYLDEKVIKQMAFEFGEEVSADLMFPEEIGITRKNRDMIKSLMIHTFTATIYKAKEGNTLKKLLQQHSIHEQINHEERQRKSMALPSFLKPKNEGVVV